MRAGQTSAARCQAKQHAFGENAWRAVRQQGSGSGIVYSFVVWAITLDRRVQAHAYPRQALLGQERHKQAAKRANGSAWRDAWTNAAVAHVSDIRPIEEIRGSETTGARTVCQLA